MMRIVFLGTPEFAVPSLRALIAAPDMEIALVVSQPDRRRSRNRWSPTPVKEVAQAANLPVITPERVNRKEVFADIQAAQPDCLVVIAYGQIIGNTLLSLYPDRIVNIHGSLLPKYRGAAPIQRALLEGEAETGLTAMLIEREMDAGDMLAVRKTPILPEDTLESLYSRMADLAAELLLDTLRHWEERLANRVKQPTEGVTFAEKIERSDGLLIFSSSAQHLVNQVRALSEWPGARFDVGEQTYRVHRAHIEALSQPAAPGTVVRADGEGIAIACADGLFVIDAIQAPGRRVLPVADFLRGHAFPVGTIVGTSA